MNNIHETTLPEYQDRVYRVLDSALSKAQTSERLISAMRYSALSSGKRLRGMLVYASGIIVSAPLERLDPLAAALECIHAYSLIHDDLPSMDDDDLRRGIATNHIEFDEATAILAGDALQALAFELINDENSTLSDSQARRINFTLAVASGARGMVGGQMLDILATQQTLTISELEKIHRAKTGDLISAAVRCGALCSEQIDNEILNKLDIYSRNIGLAFQIVDDILDIESSTETLGKTSGADRALGKATYPALIGIGESKKMVTTLYHEAIESISSISDNSALLKSLAELVVNRKH